ncbi:hypothetical protein JOM56_009020 [Amanita muscaria]
MNRYQPCHLFRWRRLKGPLRPVKRTTFLGHICCRLDPAGQNIAQRLKHFILETYPPNSNYGFLQSHSKAPISTTPFLCLCRLYAYIYLLANASDSGIRSPDRSVVANGGLGTEIVVTTTTEVCDAAFDVGCPATAVCWSADDRLYIGALDNEIHFLILIFHAHIYVLFHQTDEIGVKVLVLGSLQAN